MTVPICRDCKWVERWTPVYWSFRLCLHPDVPVDPVTGRKDFAFAQRQGHYQGCCGPKGLRFEKVWWRRP